LLFGLKVIEIHPYYVRFSVISIILYGMNCVNFLKFMVVVGDHNRANLAAVN